MLSADNNPQLLTIILGHRPNSSLRWKVVEIRRRQTALCLSRVVLSGFSGKSCLLSGFCQFFCSVSVQIFSSSILSAVRILSRFSKKLPVVCPSGRIRTRQRCPDFQDICPPSAKTLSLQVMNRSAEKIRFRTC